MNLTRRTLRDMTPADFDEIAVWRTAGAGELEPQEGVEEIADGTSDLWVGIHGKLADGTPVRGFARVECPPPALHDHTIFIGPHVIHLRVGEDGFIAGSEKIATLLDRPLTRIFPIYVRAEVKAECTGDNISQEIDITGPQRSPRDV